MATTKNRHSAEQTVNKLRLQAAVLSLEILEPLGLADLLRLHSPV